MAEPSAAPLIEAELAERVVERALDHGGDFAEVFCEARAGDETARAAGGEVAQVQASYSEGRRRVTVANSEGRFATDDRTRVRVGVQAVAKRNGTVETGFETLGGHRGFELVEGGAAERTAKRAAQIALTLLDADPAPAGAMPVVVGGGFGGGLFHRMTRPRLQADHLQKG